MVGVLHLPFVETSTWDVSNVEDTEHMFHDCLLPVQNNLILPIGAAGW